MKVRLIEYKCITNEAGSPIGHAEKVIKDAIKICNDLGLEVEVAASSCFQTANLKLPNSLTISDYNYRNIGKILQNLRVATRGKDKCIFWFINVDWYLYLYLGLHSVRQKIIATIYKERYDQICGFKGKKLGVGDLLYLFLARGVKRVDLYVETFNSDKRSSDAVYLPDYIYTKFYERFRVNQKINRVICPGTINTQKDIHGLINTFCKINYPLLIIGEFAERNLFDEAEKIKTNNITIENRRLDYEEYYRMIAESAYCITPYDMRRYTSATSGVLREAVYLGTTVIAPRRMLNNMGMNGIGYDSLSDLITVFNDDVSGKIYVNDLEQYKEENVMKTISTSIKHLAE